MVEIFGIELDDDVIQSPAYWIITGGTVLALILGFGGGGIMKGLGLAGDVNYSIPIFLQIIILALVPFISYIIVKKIQ